MIPILVLAAALAGADCGPLTPHEAGGDYTNADDANKLSVVETFHFTREVEQLKRGVSDRLGGDIGYTLDHFPNHHRALAAMAKLTLRDKQPHVLGAKYSTECYFDRALRFKQDDATVRTLYGGYLLAQGQAERALAQWQQAAEIDPGNATIHYNIGLLYVRKKDYPAARLHAHEAYKLGFPLPGLKLQLQAAHQWREGN